MPSYRSCRRLVEALSNFDSSFVYLPYDHSVENLNQQLTTLDSEFKNDVLSLDIKSSQKDLETVTIKPDKANISVKLFSLVWMPN